MSAIRVTPAVTPGDRLGMTLFLSVMLHGLIILGVGFSAPKVKQTPPPMLDIILVQSKSNKAPQEADYIAQANQDGGGDVDEKTRPSKPVDGPSIVPNASVNPKPPNPTNPTDNQPAQNTASAAKTNQQPSPKPAAATDNKPAAKDIITSEQGKNIVLSQPDKKSAASPSPATDTQQLINRSLEIASRAAAISKKINVYATRPRKKHINARTKEVTAAAYMDAWIKKVERIGNLNYPDAARRQRLSGRLILTVAINKDGSIHEITVNNASKHAVLDDSAIRIVKLGAPYARLPDELKEAGEAVEILYITRTWEFLPSGAWRDSSGG